MDKHQMRDAIDISLIKEVFSILLLNITVVVITLLYVNFPNTSNTAFIGIGLFLLAYTVFSIAMVSNSYKCYIQNVREFRNVYF